MNQIIDTKTPDIIGSIPDINGTIGAALTLKDQRESSRLIEEQAGLAFDMIQGEKITRLNADIEDMQSTVQRSKQAIDEQEKILFATSPTIKAVNIRNERTQNKTSLQFLIRIKDFTVGLGCLCLGLIVVLMGATNVYSIIMASGTPVFLDEPRLAMMLSGLLPIGSIAFKFFSSTLSNDKVKKHYTIALYGASATSLLIWVILFGITFGSVASGFDWDNLGTDSNMNIDTAFTVIQLLAEMLVGATLFQVAGDIWATYAPTTMVPNPAYEERKKNLKLLRADHGQRTQDFTRNRAHLDALKAARKAYINTQILHYKHQAAQLYGEHGTSSNAHKKERNIMKKLFTTAICLILLGLSADAQAKNLIIGLSPVLNKQDTRKQNMQVLHYLSENLEAGQEVLLFDAENRRYLGTFKKPVNKNYANIKALLQYNRSLISVLRAMNQTDHPALSEGTKGSVKIPQFLTFLAQNYAPLKDTDIVILGSPIYVDLQTPAWDMRGGRYPGDGHFGMQFNQSIFSTSGKENYLKGARIHIGFSDKDWAINETYAYFVKRMWTLYIEAQGGVLSSFTDDKTTLWNRVNRSAKALPHNFKRDMTDKLEMFEMPPASSKQVSIHARELTTILPTSDILRMAQNVEIGINWTCKKCDLDLYVRPHHAAKVLYFGHTKSELGLYHKDYTQSPKTVNGYETVTFTSTVDLNDTLIAINWYGGIALSGVTGEIRLAIGSKTYGLPFKITAKKGNAGNGRGQIIEFGKSANSNWLVISPEQILGLK